MLLIKIHGLIIALVIANKAAKNDKNLALKYN